MKFLKPIFPTILLSVFLVTNTYAQKDYSTNIKKLIKNFENSKSKDIIVVAHRGDWRNAPENSIQAIKNCIKMGVDMVEIDVRKTKDGHLVLMHDKTIDRTTTGKGLVAELTLEKLKKLYLRDGLGKPTLHKIPTLEEALIASKDKILINLDKSYSLFKECYQLLKKTKTLDQVLLKGDKTRAQLEKQFKKYLDHVYFMPKIKTQKPNADKIIDDYLDNRIPVAFAFDIPKDTVKIINRFNEIRQKGASIWVNSLWDRQNGGHGDERAALDTSVYDWYIENNINIIQTDRPQLLINYLRKKGLHR